MSKKIVFALLTVVASVGLSCGGDSKSSTCPAAECTSTCVERCGNQSNVASMTCTNDGCVCECRTATLR